MRNIFSNQFVRYSLFLLIGLLLGWGIFHGSKSSEKVEITNSETKESEVWTCAMHPQIRMEKAGKCPICAMDLIPVTQSGGSEIDQDAIHFTKESAQLANVETSVVSAQMPVKEIRLYGKIQADERLLQNQVSFVSGRIEKLLVNFTGETVNKAQVLAQIYSPELLTAQQELIESAKNKASQPEIYEAAKEKLRLWKLSEGQISEIENSGQVQSSIEILSTSAGIVTKKFVNKGDYVSQGSVLYEISDLSSVWVLFDAYESDLSFLKKGDKIDFTVSSLPGEIFSGKLAFIDPVVDPQTRVSKLRLEISNPKGKLKPEMFVTGILQAKLDEYSGKMIIPETSVLWTGKRSLVYVKLPGNDPVFRIREIELGPDLGNSFVVVSGLTEGEEIVSQGTFSVDAAAQLEGKESMMNMEIASTSPENPTGVMNSELANIEQKVFRVEGECGMCKDRIEETAKSVKGVRSAVWDLKTKDLKIEFNSALSSLNKIQKAIAIAGHDNGNEKASDTVYDALPDCCKYRK